jgi:hypothetical protein
LSTIPTPSRDPGIRDLTREIAGAPDLQITRIVATVDAIPVRGPADALIEPLRQRLKVLRPPRPLRFVRLLFDPLNALIVPPGRWRLGQNTIPRSALLPMAETVRQEMGQDAQAIEAEIVDRTNDDTGLVARLGRSLWPAAADILAGPTIPATWEMSGLGRAIYRPLADTVATLLGQAVTLDELCAETANGLLPPSPERIGVLLGHIASTRPTDLSMLIALLLNRLPAAAASIPTGQAGTAAKIIEKAFDLAANRILLQLGEDEGTEVLIAPGTLASAGAAAARIATLLEQLGTGPRNLPRREQLRALRHRLDDSCRARFTLGLQEELLTPLQNLDASPGPSAVQDLETAARGLRVLELEARAVGSGATYDFLLRKATETVRNSAVHERLTQVDKVRLVEVLAGPDAAQEMLETPR